MTPAGDAFGWRETAARLHALLRETTLAADPTGRGFLAADGRRFVPPAVQPIAGADAWAYLDGLGDSLGRVAVVLVQAGRSALGLWSDDELLAHKVITKYVVRGKGRAQPLHLKTRGKSRYGSRLRLRNAELQLVETNEKLRAWADAFGEFDLTFASVPTRTLPEWFAADPPPPFDRESIEPVPLHVHAPDFAELKRVRWALAHGRVIAPTSSSA